MPQVSDMVPSNYLKVSDLTVDDRYEERDVTIVSCSQESMPGDGELKWVLKVAEFPRGLILNVTNVRKLGELAGNASEQWPGARVRLYVAMASFQGKEVPAIRIKAARPAGLSAAGVGPRATSEIPF